MRVWPFHCPKDRAVTISNQLLHATFRYDWSTQISVYNAHRSSCYFDNMASSILCQNYEAAWNNWCNLTGETQKPNKNKPNPLDRRYTYLGFPDHSCQQLQGSSTSAKIWVVNINLNLFNLNPTPDPLSSYVMVKKLLHLPPGVWDFQFSKHRYCVPPPQSANSLVNISYVFIGQLTPLTGFICILNQI